MDNNQNTAIQNLINATIGMGATITEAMNADPLFIPCGKPASVITNALELATSHTNEETLAQFTQTVAAFIEHVSEHRSVSAHYPQISSLSDEQKQFFYTIASRAQSVQKSGTRQPEMMAQIYRDLASLE